MINTDGIILIRKQISNKLMSPISKGWDNVVQIKDEWHALNECYWMFFTSITVRVRLSLSYVNNLFLWSNGGECWSLSIQKLHVKICFIRVNQYGTRFISNNTCRVPYDVLHRPLSYSDAGRRPYDLWPRTENILKSALIKMKILNSNSTVRSSKTYCSVPVAELMYK